MDYKQLIKDGKLELTIDQYNQFVSSIKDISFVENLKNIDVTEGYLVGKFTGITVIVTE